MRLLSILICVSFIGVVLAGMILKPATPTAPHTPGVLIEEMFSGSLLRDPAVQDYSAPAQIGETHILTMPSLFGFGPDIEYEWHGIKSASVTPRPTLVLLHGSGRDGRSMLDMWDDFAREADINLIAPDSNNEAGWPLGQSTADYLEAVLNDAADTYPIDPDQIYLFGHSAGAGVAQYLANRTAGPWRAVATHAGALSASEVRQKPGAIPIYNFLGDQDPWVPIAFAQESAEALSHAGHRVELITMPHHGHWYYHIGPYMAERVWDRLVSAQDSASHSF